MHKNLSSDVSSSHLELSDLMEFALLWPLDPKQYRASTFRRSGVKLGQIYPTFQFDIFSLNNRYPGLSLGCLLNPLRDGGGPVSRNNPHRVASVGTLMGTLKNPTICLWCGSPTVGLNFCSRVVHLWLNYRRLWRK